MAMMVEKSWVERAYDQKSALKSDTLFNVVAFDDFAFAGDDNALYLVSSHNNPTDAEASARAHTARTGDKSYVYPPRRENLADGLGQWVQEGCARPRFRAFWDEGDAATRAYVIACVALADLANRSADERASVFDELTTEPRATMIARLGSGRVHVESLKTLERCDALDFRRNDWNTLFLLLDDPKTRRTLGHVKVVTPTLVRQVAAVPVGLRLPALLEVLADNAVDTDQWERLATALEDAGPTRRATLVRSARLVRTASDFWDLFHRCLDAAQTETMGKRGAIALGPRFIPLAGADAMHEEAQRMENCLGRLVDRSAYGQSLYFAWLGPPRATVELAAVAGRWVLGEVGGHANEPLDPRVEAVIRTAVGEALGANAIVDRREVAGRVRGSAFEHCIAVGRREFSDNDRAALADALFSIRGRSLGPKRNAYVVVDADNHLYFQALADPGGNYFVEISSHRYIPEVSRFLTSSAVRMLEESGFEWPRGEANFKRMWRVDLRSDCVDLADFALGALWEMFGVRTFAQLKLKVTIPVGDVERAAAEHVEALLRRPLATPATTDVSPRKPERDRDFEDMNRADVWWITFVDQWALIGCAVSRDAYQRLVHSKVAMEPIDRMVATKGDSPRGEATDRAIKITWTDDDDLASCGHGLEISYDCADRGSVVVAFVEGYGWRSGKHAEVRLLAEDASAWAMVDGNAAAIREEARAIVIEVLRERKMRLTRGRFEVWANA